MVGGSMYKFWLVLVHWLTNDVRPFDPEDQN